MCKKQLFEKFKQICKSVQLHQPASYSECKQNAQNYQQAKANLYSRFEALGLGPWLKNYPEVDQFCWHRDVIISKLNGCCNVCWCLFIIIIEYFLAFIIMYNLWNWCSVLRLTHRSVANSINIHCGLKRHFVLLLLILFTIFSCVCNKKTSWSMFMLITVFHLFFWRHVRIVGLLQAPAAGAREQVVLPVNQEYISGSNLLAGALWRWQS